MAEPRLRGILQLRPEEKVRGRGTKGGRMSLLRNQMEVQEEINLFLLAGKIRRMGMGGRLGARRLTGGFPLVGELEEPGMYPAGHQREAPDLAPWQLSANAKNRISAFMSTSRYPREKKLRIRAMAHVQEECLDGPYPFDPEGQLLTGETPWRVYPAFRFGRLRRRN